MFPQGIPKNGMTYLIYILQVHVTDVTEMPYTAALRSP